MLAMACSCATAMMQISNCCLTQSWLSIFGVSEPYFPCRGSLTSQCEMTCLLK